MSYTLHTKIENRKEEVSKEGEETLVRVNSIARLVGKAKSIVEGLK